jgi:hypothetical protein
MGGGGLTGGVVGRGGVHEVEGGGDVVALALAGEDDVSPVVCAAIGVDHLGVGGVDDGDGGLVEGAGADLLGIGEGDLLDDGGLVQAGTGGGGSGVLDEEDLVLGGVPDDGLVEDGVRLGGGDEGQGGVLADDIVELIVVDVERLGGEGLLGDAGPDEDLGGCKWWDSDDGVRRNGEMEREAGRCHRGACVTGGLRVCSVCEV